jgi:hypothetical protein
MIFVDKNINPFVMKLCVYALHANTCLRKKVWYFFDNYKLVD